MAEDMKLSVSANGTDYTALAADAVTVRSIDGGYFDDWVKGYLAAGALYGF